MGGEYIDASLETWLKEHGITPQTIPAISPWWEGVIVGYPITSVGYRVWDPVRGKIYNVGVPHVDEDVQPG